MTGVRLKELLFKNRGTRQTFLKNTFWLTVGQLGSRLLRAAVIIYAARILGAEQYGIFSYVLGLAGFFTIFADIGVNQIMTREVSRKPQYGDEYFATAFWIKAGLLFFTSLLIIFVAPHFSNIAEAAALIPLVALLTVFDNIRDFSIGYFRGKEKMQYEALLVFATNASIALFGFLILRFLPTAGALTITYILAGGTGTILGIALLRKQFARLIAAFRAGLITDIMQSAWPIALIGIIGVFMTNVDIIMLGFYRTAGDVGFYSASQKIIQLIYMLPSIVAVSMFPALSRFVGNRDTGKTRLFLEKIIRVVYLIAIPVTVGGFILAPHIIHFLYGASYEPAIPIFRILILTPLVLYPSGIISNFILANDKQKQATPFVALGSFGNIALNMLFIPLYGAVGAALATLIAQIIYQGGLWFLAKRTMQFKTLRHLKRAAVAAVLMGIFAALLQLAGLHLILNICLSILAYVGFLYLMDEDIVLELKEVLHVHTP